MVPPLPAGPSEPSDEAKVAAAGAAGMLSRQASRGFLWVFSTSGVQAGLEILILMALARVLGPTAFGIVGGGLLVMRVTEIVSKFGIGQALVQHKHLDARHIAAALWFFAVWGTLLTAFVVYTAPLQADLLRIAELREIVPVMMVGMLISNMAEVSLALLRRDLRFRIIAVTQAGTHIVAYGIVAMALAALGFGFWSLVWAYVAQVVMRGAVFMLASRHTWPLHCRVADLRELLVFGSGMTGWRLATGCAQELDNLVVARMFGAEALGLYRRAYQFSVTPGIFFGNSISTILFPVAARLRGPRELGHAYLYGVAGVALLGLPSGIFLALVAPELVATVLGSQWAETAPPMAVLALGLNFYLSQQVAGSITGAAGAVFAMAWRQVIYALAVLVGALLGLPWGLVGIATGVLAALVINCGILHTLVLRLTDIGWLELLRAHAPAIRLGVVVGGLTWSTRRAALELGLASPVVLTMCATVVSAGVLVLVRLRPKLLIGVQGLWLLAHALDLLPLAHARRVRRMFGLQQTAK